MSDSFLYHLHRDMFEGELILFEEYLAAMETFLETEAK